MVSEVLLGECRKRGIKVFAADQGALIDMAADSPQDPTRTLIRQVLGAVAQFEKSALVAKLRSARDRVRAKKGHCEGPLPYGNTTGEAHILEMMRAMCAQGNSWNEIAALLNDADFRTRTGSQWTKRSVRHVMKNSGK